MEAFLIISSIGAVGIIIWAISINGPAKTPPNHDQINSFHAKAYTEREEHKKHCSFDEKGSHCSCGRY